MMVVTVMVANLHWVQGKCKPQAVSNDLFARAGSVRRLRRCCRGFLTGHSGTDRLAKQFQDSLIEAIAEFESFGGPGYIAHLGANAGRTRT